MCLSVVKDEVKKPTTLIQSGWKDFHGTRDVPAFAAFEYKGSKTVPLDQWLTAEGDKKVKISTFSSYTPGFHVYEDEKENLPSGKRRVYYRNVHTRGTQDN